jgi:phage baseplate assembly protein gpV
MIGDVVPHFYGPRIVTDDGDGLNNLRLRVGEIQAVYGPKHPLNISKRRNEYQVWVSHRANGTAVTKIYEHCYLADGFGSFADYIRFTLRADPSAKRSNQGPGVGAKVLLLCINGESQNPVIISGIPDSAREEDPDPRPEQDGHHFEAVFNGLSFDINKDGELTVTYGGATNADGTLAEGVDEKAPGTTITVSKDGNFKVADKDSKNVVLVDHVNNKVQVTTTEYDVVADTIRHGSTDASEPHMLGNSWKSWMNRVLEAIQKITVITAVGDSSPPINVAEFVELGQEIDTLLSQTSFTD